MSLQVHFYTEEEAKKIETRQRVVNRGLKYIAWTGVLTLAAESIYRNLGGDPEIGSYIFQAGGWGLLATAVGAYINNLEHIVHLDRSGNKSLESKLPK